MTSPSRPRAAADASASLNPEAEPPNPAKAAPPSEDEQKNSRRGALMVVGAAFVFSLMSAQVKLAGKGLPFEMLVFARGAVTLVISYATVRKLGIEPWGNNRRLLVLRALFGLGGLGCFFYAITQLPLAEVTIIHYLNPVFTTVLGALLLRERIDGRVALAILVSLSGTVWVTQPSFLFGGGAPLPLSGSLAAFGGACFAACAYVSVRRLTKTENSHVIVFFFPLIATPIILPFAIMAWRWPTPKQWLFLLGIGCTTQVAQVLLTKGLALVPAGRGTTIAYVQILFASFWGFVIFGETPTLGTLVGAVLIGGATLLLVRAKG